MANGLEVVARLAEQRPGSHRLVILDVGTGDARLPMSCPTPEFVSDTFLAQAAALLQPVALLILNCVTRSGEAFEQALTAIKVG